MTPLSGFPSQFDPDRAALKPRAHQRRAEKRILRRFERLDQGANLNDRIVLSFATGAGKTFVGNNVVDNVIDDPDAVVVWISKDWHLLSQAAQDVVERKLGLAPRLARLGGSRQVLRGLPPVGRGHQVVYSTLQTLSSRLDRGDPALERLHPKLLVWDEAHWGEHAASGLKVLDWCDQHGCPVLGLTATPRESTTFEVIDQESFPSLVKKGLLARPIILDPVRTGRSWSPARSLSSGDFGQRSLSELGEDMVRNNLIVDYYARNAPRLGKTIVFGCNATHASELARLFYERHGIAARAMHTYLSPAENQEALDLFRRGAVHVLSNVGMLVYGVDVPDTQSVLLARPTLSRTLLMQSIGRGARNCNGAKPTFNVVEFTDNMERLGEDLVRARDLFPDLGRSSSRTLRRWSPPRQTHSFEPTSRSAWIPSDDTFEAGRDLWYREEQSFGIEVELTGTGLRDLDPFDDTWTDIADALLFSLRQVIPSSLVAKDPVVYEDADHSVWNCQYDSTAGWEITSRVLQGREGFEEVALVCGALTEAAADLGLGVNYQTGLHLHLGWSGRSIDEIKRAIQLIRVFEPALATLVAPSRIAHFDGHSYDTWRPNRFCQPISTVLPAHRLERLRTVKGLHWALRSYRSRYGSCNFKTLQRQGTVEVRLGSGSTEARRILLWLSLWQQVLWAASIDRPIPDVPDRSVIIPDGDVLELARQYLPPSAGTSFLERLHGRRQEILERWKRAPELAPWVDISEARLAPLTLTGVPFRRVS